MEDVEETTVVTKKRSRQELLDITDYDSIENISDAAETNAQVHPKTVKKLKNSSGIEEKENLENVNEANSVNANISTTMALANVNQRFIGESTLVETNKSSDDRMALLLGQRNVIYASFLDSFRADSELLKEKLRKN